MEKGKESLIIFINEAHVYYSYQLEYKNLYTFSKKKKILQRSSTHINGIKHITHIVITFL